MDIPAELPLMVANRHLLTHRSPGDWLIDTGSPQSFGDAPLAMPGHSVHHHPRSYGGVDTAYINRMTGLACVGLIGCDILNQYDVVFELSEQAELGGVYFSKDAALKPRGERVPIQRLRAGGLPILEVNVRGRGPVRMLFDTGAQHSYLDTLDGLETKPHRDSGAEETSDFHPSCGVFGVNIRQIAVGVGSVKAKLRFATQADTNVSPATVRKLMDAAGVAGVLGWEILKHGRMTYLPRWGELWI